MQRSENLISNAALVNATLVPRSVETETSTPSLAAWCATSATTIKLVIRVLHGRGPLSQLPSPTVAVRIGLAGMYSPHPTVTTRLDTRTSAIRVVVSVRDVGQEAKSSQFVWLSNPFTVALLTRNRRRSLGVSVDTYPLPGLSRIKWIKTLSMNKNAVAIGHLRVHWNRGCEQDLLFGELMS